MRDGLAQIMALIEPLHLNTDEAGTVELVLAEALNNVVEHGLANTPTLTAIEIRGSHRPAGKNLTVIDCGAPMPDGTAPVANTPDMDVETAGLPEGGFGWYLIHTLATDVQYARVATANHLTLQLPVGF